MVDEEQEEEEGQSPADDSGDGDKSELAIETEAANAAAERMEKAKEEIDAAEAKRRLGGTAEAGISKPKPKKLSDAEYWDATQKGEVDPFKEDGFS